LIDVGVLYHNVERLEEEEFKKKKIPNVMKEWFRKHDKKEMAKKFKSMKKLVSNSRKKKKSKAKDGYDE